jgi:hypothetical protein
MSQHRETGHLVERSPGHWAIVISVRDPATASQFSRTASTTNGRGFLPPPICPDPVPRSAALARDAPAAANVHPKIASERLGHSHVGLTLDTYSHVLPGMQEGRSPALTTWSVRR